ncbi:MAG: transporter [Negativicutes bacterium]|nr:transporter [Negativicutes bacterium]
MDITLKIAYIEFDLILPLVVGYLCRYQTYCGETFFEKMININVWVTVPILSLLSFWVLHLNYSLIWLMLFGLILCAISGLAAYLWGRDKYSDDLDRGSYILAAMLSNIGTLGGLCAFILYGEIGYAYTQLVTILQSVVTFMFCYPLAQYYYLRSVGGTRRRTSLKAIFLNLNQLPMVGLLVGAMLYLSGIPRPTFLGALFDPLVHVVAWTALIPIGFSTDFSAMKQYYRGALDLIPIKFIVTPVVAYALASVVITDKTALNTLLILSSTPTAISSVLAAKIYNLNINIANAAFVLTTAVFLVVVYPALFLWITLH